MNNLTISSSAQYHQIIQSGNFPDTLNSFQKHEIKTMYESGKQYEAILKLQGLIDKPLIVKSKSLL